MKNLNQKIRVSSPGKGVHTFSHLKNSITYTITYSIYISIAITILYEPHSPILMDNEMENGHSENNHENNNNE